MNHKIALKIWLSGGKYLGIGDPFATSSSKYTSRIISVCPIVPFSLDDERSHASRIDCKQGIKEEIFTIALGKERKGEGTISLIAQYLSVQHVSFFEGLFNFISAIKPGRVLCELFSYRQSFDHRLQPHGVHFRSLWLFWSLCLFRSLWLSFHGCMRFSTLPQEEDKR